MEHRHTGSAREVYLDNNATTQPLPEVREAMLAALGPAFGNPSSAHAAGERARVAMTQAREAVASLVGATPEQLVFTSSGTEANALVLASLLHAQTVPPRVVTTTVEHSSILQGCAALSDRGVDVVALPVNRAGLVSLADLERALTPETALVSIQWVNNETGVIQPIESMAALCRHRGVLFHTDAAQAVGKLPIDVATLPIDFLSLTAHKFHGPQGIGALYARQPRHLVPLFYGGDQEQGRRAGTENVPGIVGLGTAARLRAAQLAAIQHQLRQVRDAFEQRVLTLVPGTVVNGDRAQRVCNTTNLRFPGLEGQALVAQLDQRGIRCSQSSACTNHRPEPSYVLRAMGLSEEEAYASVRFSVSTATTLDDVVWTAEQIAAICQQLQAFLRLGLRPHPPQQGSH